MIFKYVHISCCFLAPYLIIRVMNSKQVDAVDIVRFDGRADPDKMQYFGEFVGGFLLDTQLESVL